MTAKLATNATIMKEVMRLQKYLLELHMSERACVFSNFSGHVDHIDIRICPDRNNYNIELYEIEVGIPAIAPKYEHLIYLRKRDWKKYIDEIIEDIEDALAYREEKIAEAAKEREALERARYEALKEKYEGA